MITRSKLVEQLRDYQIRSQHKWGVLVAFSPKPQITSRRDVVVALTYALFFCFLMVTVLATWFCASCMFRRPFSVNRPAVSHCDRDAYQKC